MANSKKGKLTELSGTKESRKPFGNKGRGKGTGKVRRDNRRSKSNSKYGSTSSTNGQSAESNPLVESMSIETPMSARSKVFASDSASIQSFGTFTTTPGQDNFIESFNTLITGDGATGYNWVLSYDAEAKRISNAMVIGVTPWFGSTDVKYTGTWLSPLQLAAVNLKQYIDTSFGTRTDYDTQDLMMYLLGVYAVFPVIAEIKRDIRLVYTFQQDHYPAFLPQGLFAALRLPDDSDGYLDGQGALYAAHHLRTYIDQLNQLIITFNRLPMPPEIKAFGYNDDFFDAIYMDSDDITTAQLYVFENTEYWEYQESPELGASLVPIPFGVKNIGARLVILSNMISRLSALRTSSTAMLQNLFNAYGSRDQVQVPTMDINTLTPLDFVKDDNILTMIDNLLICHRDCATLSRIIPDHESSNIYGHMWINEADIAGPATYLIFNLPLQFHKPYDLITQEDIGWALRLHPNFCNKKLIALWDDTHSGESATVMTADEHMGFAVCRSLRIASINDNGMIRLTEQIDRHEESRVMRLGDFKAHPIQVFAYNRVDPNTMTITCHLGYYDGRRDVEATYRIEDIAMHWTYLTMEMWGSNVNRNVVGTRTKGIG